MTKKQAVCTLTLFVVSGIPVLTGYTVAERNVWLAYLIAFLAALPLYLIYARLSELYCDKTFFEITAEIFGKTVGKIIAAVYVLYCINIAAMSLRNVSEFAGTVSLDKTPRFFIVAVCSFVCFYVASRGLRAVTKFAVLFLPILLAAFVVFFICSANIYNVGNLEPLTVDSFSALFENSYVCFVFPVAEVVVLLNLMPSVKKKKGETKKIFIFALLISAALVLAVSVSNVLSLGVPTMTKLYYPTYAAISLIEIGVVRRLEVVASALFFTAGILKSTLSLSLAREGVEKVFAVKKYPKGVLLLLSVTVAAVAEFLYPSVIELVGFLKFYVHYAAVLQLLPVIFWIIAEIKNKKAPKTDNKK